MYASRLGGIPKLLQVQDGCRIDHELFTWLNALGKCTAVRLNAPYVFQTEHTLI